MINVISGRNIDITDALRDTIDKKLGKLDKYFHNETSADVTLSVEKNRNIVEVTIHVPGNIIRAEESSDDMYASIDKTVDRLETQIRRQKERLRSKKLSGETIRFENIAELPEEETKSKIVRHKRFAVKPMNEEEAVLQMELLGHSFFVFTNADSGEANVIYKRKDGNYGFIEPEY